MGRLIAFILGGAALALYAPYVFLPQDGNLFLEIDKFWKGLLKGDWFERVFGYGPGVLAGIAMLLIATRGRD